MRLTLNVRNDELFGRCIFLVRDASKRGQGVSSAPPPRRIDTRRRWEQLSQALDWTTAVNASRRDDEENRLRINVDWTLSLWLVVPRSIEVAIAILLGCAWAINGAQACQRLFRARAMVANGIAGAAGQVGRRFGDDGAGHQGWMYDWT